MIFCLISYVFISHHAGSNPGSLLVQSRALTGVAHYLNNIISSLPSENIELQGNMVFTKKTAPHQKSKDEQWLWFWDFSPLQVEKLLVGPGLPAQWVSPTTNQLAQWWMKKKQEGKNKQTRRSNTCLFACWFVVKTIPPSLVVDLIKLKIFPLDASRQKWGHKGWEGWPKILNAIFYHKSLVKISDSNNWGCTRVRK